MQFPVITYQIKQYSINIHNTELLVIYGLNEVYILYEFITCRKKFTLILYAFDCKYAQTYMTLSTLASFYSFL